VNKCEDLYGALSLRTYSVLDALISSKQVHFE